MGTLCQSISHVEQTWPVQFPGISATVAATQRTGDYVQGTSYMSKNCVDQHFDRLS